MTRCSPRCCASTSIIPTGQGVLGAEGQSVRRHEGRSCRRRGPTACAIRGGMTVDQKTGHVWVGQNGQDLWEQAYLVNKGDNYGWSVIEGSHPFYPNRKPGPTPIVKPTVEHHHSESRSLTGGIVYYGSEISRAARRLHLRRLLDRQDLGASSTTARKSLWHKELADTTLAITGFGIDSQGRDPDRRPSRQGRRRPLSRWSRRRRHARHVDASRRRSARAACSARQGARHGAGADSVFGQRRRSGPTAPHKERWLGLPGADAKIDFTAKRGWNFPDQTVIVKSFALETRAGQPAVAPLDRDALPDASRTANGTATPTSGTTSRPRRRWSRRRRHGPRVHDQGRTPATQKQLALSQPDRVHGLPQPGRQLRAGL